MRLLPLAWEHASWTYMKNPTNLARTLTRIRMRLNRAGREGGMKGTESEMGGGDAEKNQTPTRSVIKTNATETNADSGNGMRGKNRIEDA